MLLPIDNKFVSLVICIVNFLFFIQHNYLRIKYKLCAFFSPRDHEPIHMYIIFVTISVTAMGVCGGQRPAFQSARERRRIGGQIFAVSSSVPGARTVGSGLIKAAGVSGKSREDGKEREEAR